MRELWWVAAVCVWASCGTEPTYDEPAEGCEASGGTVATAECCAAVIEPFPDLCLEGACGCALEFSHELEICACPGDTCFDSSTNTCVSR